MELLDFLVIALYAAAMLGVGFYYSRRTKTAEDYLLGGRQMSPLLIGLSLFATLTSTLTYLALPGEMVKYGPMVFAQILGYPLVWLIVGWWIIPAIMRQHNITSGYQLLELRLGLTGRLLGAGMFVALRIVWMASILYATSATVIVPLFKLPPVWMPWISVALGVVTVIYTAQGGLRGVVVTDAAQSIIMCIGAIVTIAVVTASLGGFSWWPRQWQTHWTEPVFWFHATNRMTFMGAILNMAVWTVCTAGSDQMAIQRYLATRDAPSARRSFGVNLIVNTVMAVLLGLVGLAVLGYFTAHPSVFGEGVSLVKSADQLFPRFVVVGLPAGLTGLVIAAILSAAMSSLSSGMNSSSAVIATDFVGRFLREPPGYHQELRLAQFVSVAVGVVAIALSTVVGQLATNLLELCIKVVNLLTAPLFVLFFLALFVRWATPLGAAVATVAGIAVAVGITFYNLFGLTFIWSSPCSLLAGVVVGVVVSLVPIGRRQLV